jgi:hypothetical protein
MVELRHREHSKWHQRLQQIYRHTVLAEVLIPLAPPLLLRLQRQQRRRK